MINKLKNFYLQNGGNLDSFGNISILNQYIPSNHEEKKENLKEKKVFFNIFNIYDYFQKKNRIRSNIISLKHEKTGDGKIKIILKPIRKKGRPKKIEKMENPNEPL